MTLTEVISKRNVFGTDFFGKKAEFTDNSSSDAVRITQQGSGNALVVEDSTSPDNTPFVVNSDGKVIIGKPTAGSFTAPLQVYAASGSNLNLAKASSDNIGVRFFTQKSRGTQNAELTVNPNDELCQFEMQGYTGSGLISAAKIEAAVDGNPSPTTMPGSLSFWTTQQGNANPSERITIKNDGRVGIGTNAPTNTLHIDGSLRVDGDVRLDTVLTSTTVGAAGPATALPATPEGYLLININGTQRRIPFYQAP